MIQKVLALLVAVAMVTLVRGHGRLMDPPMRSSVWRIPEFKHLNPAINYNDNQLFCGGFYVQHELNKGKCGLCGDSYDSPQPRDNEAGGRYSQGIIVRNYKSGQVIDVDVELTASHFGHFEFRLCKTFPETEECFDELLEFVDGNSRFRIPTLQSGHYYPKVKLPSGISCDHCVLQWSYIAGNNWGFCGNGTGAVGCGPQETFRGCSDISIQ